MKNDQKERKVTVEYDKEKLKKNIIKISVIEVIIDVGILGVLLIAFKVFKL